MEVFRKRGEEFGGVVAPRTVEERGTKDACMGGVRVKADRQQPRASRLKVCCEVVVDCLVICFRSVGSVIRGEGLGDAAPRGALKEGGDSAAGLARLDGGELATAVGGNASAQRSAAVGVAEGFDGSGDRGNEGERWCGAE